MTDNTAPRAWKFHRFSNTRGFRGHMLRFTVTSAEYITVNYDGQEHDVINTWNHQADEPTIYDRADFLREVDEYMSDAEYIINMLENL